MNQFTPGQTVRWDAWQRANVISARRGDRLARFCGRALLAAALVAVAAALTQ